MSERGNGERLALFFLLSPPSPAVDREANGGEANSRSPLLPTPVSSRGVNIVSIRCTASPEPSSPSRQRDDSRADGPFPSSLIDFLQFFVLLSVANPPRQPIGDGA